MKVRRFSTELWLVPLWHGVNRTTGRSVWQTLRSWSWIWGGLKRHRWPLFPSRGSVWIFKVLGSVQTTHRTGLRALWPSTRRLRSFTIWWTMLRTLHESVVAAALLCAVVFEGRRLRIADDNKLDSNPWKEDIVQVMRHVVQCLHDELVLSACSARDSFTTESHRKWFLPESIDWPLNLLHSVNSYNINIHIYF